MDDSEKIDLQTCEACGEEGPVENFCMHDDVWICESCDADFRNAFASCKHQWETETHINNMGEEGRICSKCNGFVRLEDFADVVGSDPIRARSEQEEK